MKRNTRLAALAAAAMATSLIVACGQREDDTVGQRLDGAVEQTQTTSAEIRADANNAAQDMKARAVVEARVDADRMLIATQSALDADGDVLSPKERAAIDALMVALRHQRDADDAAVIEAATDALAKGTEGFAAQRMNRGIQQALAGKNVASL